MENQEDKNRDALLKLTQIFLEAMIKSGETRIILHSLIENNIIKREGFLNFTVNVDALLKGEIPDIPKILKERREKTQGRRETDVPVFQKIDGQKLSEQEIRFAEFCAKNFNEKKWLKQLRLNKGG